MKQYQIDRIKDFMDAKGITSKELASNPNGEWYNLQSIC